MLLPWRIRWPHIVSLREHRRHLVQPGRITPTLHWWRAGQAGQHRRQAHSTRLGAEIGASAGERPRTVRSGLYGGADIGLCAAARADLHGERRGELVGWRYALRGHLRIALHANSHFALQNRRFLLCHRAPGAFRMLLGAALAGGEVLDAVQAQTTTAIACWADDIAALQFLRLLCDK